MRLTLARMEVLMKCQKCGSNQVSFFYSSNVNGAVTETCLCSECAGDSDKDFMSKFDMTRLFDEFFGEHSGLETSVGGSSIFMPFLLPEPLFGYGSAVSKSRPVKKVRIVSNCNCGCGDDCGTANDVKPNERVDNEMREMRELGVLREQMRLAVEKENFEEAARLRDELRKRENRN